MTLARGVARLAVMADDIERLVRDFVGKLRALFLKELGATSARRPRAAKKSPGRLVRGQKRGERALRSIEAAIVAELKKARIASVRELAGRLHADPSALQAPLRRLIDREILLPARGSGKRGKAYMIKGA